MSEALARVYALQQRELNAKERERQRQIAKHQRIVAAFNASGFLDIFNEFRRFPVRPEVRSRVYKQRVGELTWHENMQPDQTHSMSFMSINGQSNGPRWWCEENADSGNMKYGYSSGRSGDRGEFFDTPRGLWLDAFIEYMAYAADPEAVANQMPNNVAPELPATPRRQVQPV